MIGDGFLSADFHQLGFATGIHEDINEYYSNILKKYCSSAIYSHDKRNIHEQVGKWCVNSQYFVNLMVDMGFTTSVYTKRIPTWVFSCSREIKEQFILGFMDADGWIKKNNTGAQSFEIELCNKKLTEDLKELCHQIGWNVSCEIRKRTKAAREIVGVCVNELDSYTIYLRKEENNSIFEDIVSVEKTDEYSDVYDIRVDNDLHNFVADGCVVHNSPERRVFYIGVGNVAPQDIPAFMEKAKTQLKRNQIVDSNSGRVDLRYNPLCNSLKTLIFLQNGKTITLGDLIKEWDSGKKDQWVYSVDLENKEVVPGKVVWAGITRKNADIVRVHLDNKKYIDVTPDHKFVMRDGTYVEAKDLKTGDALMPLYKKWLTKEDGHKIIGYEKIYDPFRQSYVFTNRNDVIQTCGFEAIEGKNVHHKDFDKLNNSPENLQLMKWKDHCKLHGEMVLEYKNHKVAKIEFLSEKEDTGCITVDTYHNFAIAGHCD